MHQLDIPILLALGLLGLLSVSPDKQSRFPQNPGKVDCVDFGNRASAKAHAVASKGAVSNETLNVEMGTLREKYPVTTLGGRGSELSVSLRVSRPKGSASTPIVLEVQEIHNRRAQAFGYTVQVNGKNAYFRTYDEMAAGPNHYFIQIPAADAGDGNLGVTFRNDGDAPFSLGKVWAYGDFVGLTKEEGTLQPMPVVENATVLLPGFTGKGADGKETCIKVDEETEAKAWDELKARMQGTGFAPGITTNISYGNTSFADIKKAIDKDLGRVAKYGLSYDLALNGSEWGYHPDGPDGLGGYFSDIKYSKIHYDPTLKDYRPCWPGTPGNTTWPTWDDPQLNSYLAYRITQAVQYFRDRRDFMAARGARFPDVQINQEWGMGVKDCNDATIAAAKKDGITLTPEDGFNEQEKKWVFDNACRAANRFGEAFRNAAGRDRVVIDRGVIQLPEQQIRDANHFQTFADPIDPYYDDQWAGWQFGVGANAWVTGEFLPHLPAAYYDYIMARGKLAGLNMERLAMPVLDYYQTLYQRGFRMVTPINARPGDADKFLPQAAGLDNKPADPALHADRKLLAFRFLKDGELGPKGALVEANNVKGTVDPGTYDCLKLVNPNSPGTITYKVTNDSPDPGKPVLVNLVCKIPMGSGGTIAFAVGDTPSDLKVVATLTDKEVSPVVYYHWRSVGSADLGESVRGKKSFYLQITLNGKTSNDAIIERLQVVSAWPQRSGQMNGETFTVGQKRTFHLWLQDRAIYERAAARYKQEHGDDEAFKTADSLAEQGRYRSAYQSISNATSLGLPAGFAVRGHGKLGPYPVSVKLPGEDDVVLIELIRAGPPEFEFELKSETPVQCQIELGPLPSGDGYAVESAGANRYRIVLATGAAAAQQVKDGRLLVEVPAIPAAAIPRVLPRRLSGIAYSIKKEGIWINTQEPELWMDNPIFVPLAPGAKFPRKRAGTESPVTQSWPSDWDQVDLVINESGQATEVAATYGKESGKIKAFYPPKAKGDTSNGVIELENGHRYEFSNMWWFTSLKDVPPLQPFIRSNTNEQLAAAFTPGKSVDIEFCPYSYNGRLPRMVKISTAK